tara:strand:+ start:22 stop:402 length:381 start_codon:yes stop_codon:yes gene_type:complete
MKELDFFCKTNNVSKADLCIVGSYILQELGIRKASDIDFIMLPSERKRLGFPRSNKRFTDNVELVTQNWHPTISDENVINNSSYHTLLPCGFKIINLSLLVDKKSSTKRDKDLIDLDLINKYLNEK